jgi:cell division transport system permease protein
MTYSVREALAAFRRAPLLAGVSAAMIALSLFVVGLFGLAAYNIRKVIQGVEARVEVVAYLRDDAGTTAVQQLQRELRTLDAVRAVRYVSREEALQVAREELTEFNAVFGSLESNPLPASLEVQLQPNQKGPDVVRAVADRIGAEPIVEEVRYGNEWLDKVFLLRRVAATGTAVLGTGFAAVAVLIIGAAVRLAIFARRNEIAIMQLVGATNWFIRKPFLLEGLITGVTGGLIAAGATWVTYSVLTSSVFTVVWIPTWWIVVGVLGGGALGVMASWLAVRRHLNVAA